MEVAREVTCARSDVCMGVGSECVEMGTYVETVGIPRVRALAEGVDVRRVLGGGWRW